MEDFGRAITAVSSQTTIGIVGHGYVGKIVENFFKDHYKVIWFDPNQEGTASKETINRCDLAIVCVPTPMLKNGGADTSIVREVIDWLKTPLILLRSTVPPGTTNKLIQETGKRIVFSPEYAGEGKYWDPYKFHTDEKESPFYIFGGFTEDCETLIDLYVPIGGPKKLYRITDATTAELVKYCENTYFAWKVTFANEMKQWADAFGVPFWELRDLWALDPRVDPMHTAVFPGNPGFGGKCLPKDTLALLKSLEQVGYNSQPLRDIIRTNMQRRKGVPGNEYPTGLSLDT